MVISEVQLWKKFSFLVLTSGKFLEALGSRIGTGSILCLSFSLSNRVFNYGNDVAAQLSQKNFKSTWFIFDSRSGLKYLKYYNSGFILSLENCKLLGNSHWAEKSLFLQSTPYPPLTLSLGSWQITEEDLPIYVGSAAGVLLLIILLLGVTTWRCSTVPSSLSTTSNQSPTKSAREDTGKACLFRVTVYWNDLKYIHTGPGKAFKIVPRQAYSSTLFITYSLKPLKLLKYTFTFPGSVNKSYRQSLWRYCKLDPCDKGRHSLCLIFVWKPVLITGKTFPHYRACSHCNSKQIVPCTPTVPPCTGLQCVNTNTGISY